MKSKSKEESKDNTFLTVKEVSKKTSLNSSQIYTILHYDRLNYSTIGGRIVISAKDFGLWEQANIKPKEKDNEPKEKEEKK